MASSGYSKLPISGVRTAVDARRVGEGDNAATEVPVWRAVPLFILGSEGAPIEFGSVRSILLAPHGKELYVVDPSKREISIFDSTGRFIRILGRTGSGPGEYRDPYSVAWIGKNLALLDPGNARLGLFDSTGRWLRSWPIAPITGGQFIRLYRTSPTAWIYGSRQNTDGGVFIRYQSSGPVDTLPIISPPKPMSRGRKCERPDHGITYFAQPFGPSLLQIPLGDGTRAVAVTTRYRVAVVNTNGDTLRVITRETPLANISDADWTAANADWVTFHREWPTARCDAGEFSRPATKPPLVSLFTDDQGRLWIERAAPTGPQYDVVSTKGIVLATVVGLPASGGVDPTVAGDRIAFVSQDSNDSPVVRVFRLQP